MEAATFLEPPSLQNPRALYGLLFRAASKTLLTLAADPQHLGARIGFIALLHTWGQTLGHHPHLHCLVPGGGLSEDQSEKGEKERRRGRSFLEQRSEAVSSGRK